MNLGPIDGQIENIIEVHGSQYCRIKKMQNNIEY